MRWLAIWIGLVCLAAASPALAKPKVAIVPVTGDSANKVSNAIVDAIDGRVDVVGPKEVSRVLDRLGLSGQLDSKQLRRLQAKLGVRAVVHGRIEKDGVDRVLVLGMTMRAKKISKTEIRFRNASTVKFRAEVREVVLSKIDGAGEDGEDDGDSLAGRESRTRSAARAGDDGDEPPSQRRARFSTRSARDEAEDDDGGSRRKQKPKLGSRGTLDDEDAGARKRRARDDDGDTGARKRVARRDDDDAGSRKRASKARGRDDADEDTGARKRGKRVARRDDDEREDRDRDREDRDDEPRIKRTVTQRAVSANYRIDAGLSFDTRRLRFASTGAMPPPAVSTGAAGGRIEGEIYPFSKSGSLAKLGFAGVFDHAFSLGIENPGSSQVISISQSHWALGARYRFALGQKTALALGGGLARRSYVADRAGLAAPTDFDMPDTVYTALNGSATLRAEITPKVTASGEAGPLLMLSTGPIQDTTSYGPATVFGVEVRAGADIAVAKSIAVKLGLEFTQISFKFNGAGAMAAARGVSGATDRDIVIASTLVLVY